MATIKFIVKDDLGNPLPDATVFVTDVWGVQVFKTAKTGSDGTCSITMPYEPNFYLVHAEHPLFYNSYEYFLDFKTDTTFTISFFKRKPTPTPTPTPTPAPQPTETVYPPTPLTDAYISSRSEQLLAQLNTYLKANKGRAYTDVYNECLKIICDYAKVDFPQIAKLLDELNMTDKDGYKRRLEVSQLTVSSDYRKINLTVDNLTLYGSTWVRNLGRSALQLGYTIYLPLDPDFNITDPAFYTDMLLESFKETCIVYIYDVCGKSLPTAPATKYGYLDIFARLNKADILAKVKIDDKELQTPLLNYKVTVGTHTISCKYDVFSDIKTVTVKENEKQTVTFDFFKEVRKAILNLRARLDLSQYISIPVKVDGQTATTPASLQLDPGTYTVSGTYLGKTVSKTVTLSEGATVDEVLDFITPKATLSIKSTLDGRSISIPATVDGIQLTTPSTIQLTPGTYTVKGKYLDYESVKTVTLSEGETKTISLDFITPEKPPPPPPPPPEKPPTVEKPAAVKPAWTFPILSTIIQIIQKLIGGK